MDFSNIELNYSNIIFEKIKNELKSEINDNKSILLKANDIDLGVIKKHINLERITEIIDSYSLEEENKKITNTIAVVYNGNPYVTINLCMQAISSKNKVILFYDDFMLGVNSVLIAIIQKVLKEYKLNDLVLAKELSKNINFEKLASQILKIVVIGKTNFYERLKIENKVFFPSNNSVLYCDNDKFEEIKNAIYEYSMGTQEELEIVKDENLESLIKTINQDEYSNIVIVLSENSMTQDLFEKNILNKKVYINKNPFKDEKIKVYNYL